MNVFKSLGKLIWGDASNPELVQISSGQFYVYKPTGSKQRTRECVYIDSMATIRRTSQPYQYVLAINRVFEEGEETLQDDDQELDDEKVFLIDKDIMFKKGVFAGATTFSWKGLSNDDRGLEYEFVCDEETTVFTANNFEITVYQCMYERKYQKSHFSAEEEAIEEFQLHTTTTSSSPPRAQGSSTPKKSVKKEKTASVKHEEDEDEYTIDKPSVRHAPSKYEGVAEAVGELNLFDARTNLFMSQADEVRCQLLRTGKYAYWLVVRDTAGKELLAQPLESRMNAVFSSIHRSFIWNYFDDQNNVFSWLIRFPSEAALSEFQSVFGECMYEALNRESWSKVTSDDQEYLIKTYQSDVEMTESDRDGSQDGDHESDVYSDEDDGNYDQDEDQEDYDEDEEDEAEVDGFQQDTAMNSQLAVGYKDRSFVVRGNKIGVFKHNDHDGLDFSTTIKNVSNSKGREINPSRVVLHEQDTAMVMMDPRDLDTAYKMDLEYGKIVEEWQLPGTSGVLNIIGDSKYSHLTDNKTMIGHSRNALFRIDPRLSGAKIVGDEFKQYAAKGNDFTCITTTDNGSIAVAGAKGEIKLRNVLTKNAKTALPGLGDPIIGIDVTANGRWVIATCKAYLLLIDVLNPTNKMLGFDASFPAKEKPQAIKLQLRPEHVASMKQGVSFTTARFNTGVNEEEKTIVTSTGPYVITWNFRRVKNGHYEYQIKQYADSVVADNFKFGQDRSIIVALPHDVTAVAKRNLVSPAEAFKVGVATCSSAMY
ncbi:hypothetical protein BGZ72_008390 [Mortierella alpina]|nr:hypothetical protein BGZ72_008390 [Mortierella alpina]